LQEAYLSEIEISINSSFTNVDPAEVIQPKLTEFDKQHHMHTLLQVYDWAVAWTEFLKISLYQHGPVISQTGNTWMGSLIAQNSLRAFSDKEIAELGGKESFVADAWESCLDFENKQLLAVPLILDTYVVYYRRNVLKKAGVDEASAFSTLENFHATLQKLQNNGEKYPFAIPTNSSRSNMHTLASWVWGQGGDFISPEGTRVTLNQPETRKGIKMYFELYRFISPEAQNLNDMDCWNWFFNSKIAVTLRNPELLFRLKQKEFPESFAADIGVAVIPGVPLLGGSHLVIWSHVLPEQEQDAINLIKFLTSADLQLTLLENAGLIPANLQALESISPASIFAPAIQSVRKARGFKRIRMWGLIEDKMVIALSQVWKMLLTTPNPNLDQILASHLDPIQDRLNITLSQ
jgi:multiple sugar transport system substrate-binding protein